MTNSRKSREQNVLREKKFMLQNEAKESDACCPDENCYCRRQKLQETISKEANDVNEVDRVNVAIIERLVFLNKFRQ